ncbi:MAG TPA: DHA2 family efflux MFS transporter permease subunit [Acidimicrobiales bacterium]|nr:DHA2 family efflux MFS transporter permease subunit [Acidimicrobiales bacterium]
MIAAHWRERIDDPEQAHPLRWWTLATLCLTLVVISIDNNILNVAIPTLSHPTAEGGLGASASQLQWIIDGYVIVFAGLLLTTGSLGDRYGRYRFLAAGLVVFGVGSTLAAFAPSANFLALSRCVMGVGASFIMPATLSILSNVFTDVKERRRAIGIWASVSASGSTLGPVTGGVLIAHFWWGSIFLVNLPVVVIALVAGRRLIPDSRDPAARPLDPVGALLSIAALVVLLWGVIEAPGTGWGSPRILVAFAVGAALVFVFIRWELATEHPMLDLHFFEDPRFSIASLAIALTFLSMYGSVFMLTQYLQAVRGLTPTQAGATLIPQSMIFMAAALVVPNIVERIGGKVVVAAGLLVLSGSMSCYTLLRAGTAIPEVMVITAVMGMGMALVMAAATDSIMGSVPKERAGVGSAMNDTTRQMGGAVGIAVLGSILATRYSSVLTSSLPAGLRSRLGDSVGEATSVAHARLHGATAARVIEAAHHAYLSGMRVAMLGAASVVLLAVVPVVLWLPARGRDELHHFVVSEDGPATVIAD